MRSEEFRIGARVRVPEDHRVRELRGMVGTVVRTYRSPDHTALHVRFGDGLWQLFWPQELEELGEGPEEKPETGRRGRRPLDGGGSPEGDLGGVG